jgi:predicted phosphodiesterase
MVSEDIKDCAIFIIGDVHGCLDELEELLQAAKMEVNGKNILPIFVGDLANKGPHNSATIRKIRGLHAYAVRGNHDEAYSISAYLTTNVVVRTPFMARCTRCKKVCQ